MAETVLDVIEQTRNKPGTVVFYSRYREHTVVRRPKVEAHLATGLTQLVSPGRKYHFRDVGGIGVLVVTKGQDVMEDGLDWLADDQEQGIARDLCDALKAHRYYNQDFWLEGEEPDRLLPTDEDFLGQIAAATVDLDVDKLGELLQQEKESHQRPLLLRTAMEALTRARKARADLEAAAAAGNGQNGSEEGAAADGIEALTEPEGKPAKK